MFYSVNEIFYSLQGEGYYAGTPAVFIRFSGCNLKCGWCDTDHKKFNKLTPRKIVQITKEFINPTYDPNRVLIVLTGGEPTMVDIRPLIKEFLNAGMSNTIAIESNGYNLKDVTMIVDWITFSPKVMIEDCSKFFDDDDFMGDEVKIVFEEGIDEKLLQELPRKLEDRFGYFYIQPCSENFDPAVQFVKENPQWNLSVQIHKLLNII